MSIRRLALAALLAGVACHRENGAGASSAGAAAGATDHVDLPRSYLFQPTRISVTAGTRVTWTNHDVFTHAVQLADSGARAQVMKPGDSVSLVLTVPGEHHYDCPFHPQMMKGVILVSAR